MIMEITLLIMETSWKNHGILFLNFCGNPAIDKDILEPNCVNKVRYIVVHFSDVISVFVAIQKCENGGRTKYCRFDIST